jgi:hypothetical protein
MIGPGKHDALVTEIRERLSIGETGGVMLIVIAPGEDQSGFSCQADLRTTMAIPEILESTAAQIREDRAKVIP